MAETPSGFGTHAYTAWGLAILNFVVPTAATAGLLTVMVRWYDRGFPLFGSIPDYPLVLGLFAASSRTGLPQEALPQWCYGSRWRFTSPSPSGMN
jgi:hypothetical protein